MTEITIRGQKELERKLRKLNPRQLEASLLAGGKIIEGEMRQYPPAPAGSTYVRTGELGRQWKTTPKRSDFAVQISNTVSYAPFVQGDKRQASIHRGRWKTLKKTATDKLDDVVKQVKKQVDRILERG